MDKMSKTELFGQAGMKNRKFSTWPKNATQIPWKRNHPARVKIAGDAQLQWDSRTQSTTPCVPILLCWSRTFEDMENDKCVKIPSERNVHLHVWSKNDVVGK